MKFREFLDSLTAAFERPPATAGKVRTVEVSWMDNATALGKYRRRRAVRNRMAAESRRRNR